jgi:hypothetical protein
MSLHDVYGGAVQLFAGSVKYEMVRRRDEKEHVLRYSL